MATATHPVPALLTLDEYLRTPYHPDCDFVDGHLEERTLRTPKHAYLQMLLGHWFLSRRKQWKVIVVGDVRTRTGTTRVRLPDVAIVTEEAATLDEPWVVAPPLICIEILSPEDRLQRVTVLLEEYRAVGVSNIWVLDPIERTGYTYAEAGLQRAGTSRLSVPNSPIYLDLPEPLASLD